MEAFAVELKLTVSEGGQQAALEALGVDPLDTRIRQVYFFDTPELALFGAGVVVRARRIQQEPDDAIVKLRPVVLSELPKEVRSSPAFSAELDGMPGAFVLSGTMKRKLGGDAVREVTSGARPLRRLLTEEQRALYAAHAPAGLVLGDLSVLGPVFTLKVELHPAGYARPLVAETWVYPDDSRVLELSTRCMAPEAIVVAAELRAFLTGRGVDIGGEQETKTRKALEFFSRRLKAARGAAAIT